MTSFLFFVVVPFLVLAIRFNNTTTGIHSGYVTAVQQNGYLFPNYKVYFKTDNSSSQEDVYCVNRHNQALGDELKKYNVNRERVTLEFKGVKGFGVDLCSGQEITKVNLDK